MNYQYQEAYKEIGKKGQALLEAKTVTLVGIGGVGSAVAEMLARSGVNLRLVDKDRVFEEDLQRLSLFQEEDVTKFKAKEAKKILEKITKKPKIKVFHEELTRHNTFLLDAEIVVDCTNDLATSVIINKHARKSLLVCFYAGDSGLIFHRNKKLNSEKLRKEIEKLKTVKEVGIINPTVHMAAAIVVSEVLKLLLKKKPTAGLIQINSWMNTVKVKK
ncbi:MAG: ThiF family adenylyltransferase [Nanoarchaeota archaeon]